MLARGLGLGQLLAQVEHPLHQLDHLVMPHRDIGEEYGKCSAIRVLLQILRFPCPAGKARAKREYSATPDIS